METVTVKEFCKEKGFNGISPIVRESVNGIPFLTFYNEKEAENIYFSKSLATTVGRGQILKKEFFSDVLIGKNIMNANNEVRTKIVSPRISIDDLLD